MGGEWICLGVVDLLGIISFFLLSLVVRKLVVGYLKDTNAGECSQVLARVGFLYLRFLTNQLQQAHPPTVDAHELHRVALTRHLNEILRGVAF